MKNYIEEKEFRVRSYGRTELALMYSPELTPTSAYRKLVRWIRRQPELSSYFIRNGKMPTSRCFTPADVRQIVCYLGEPG